ncbi:MAG: hypothetical protein ABSB01_19800 [Streptosporangiaceae bacterium]
MTDAWMPGAARIRAETDGGALKGGAPRTVWQALGFDPRIVSARSAAERLNQLNRPSHLVWNPLNGEIVQLIPVVRAGRSIGWPEGVEQLCRLSRDQLRQAALRAEPPPGPFCEINAEGRLCIQICVVAFAWEPFTAGPLAGLREILDWLDSWGMARNWPAGRPAPFPHGHASYRNRRLWARGGHFGASQVPDWTASGPGAVDVERLTGTRQAAALRGPGVLVEAPAAPPGGRQPGSLTDLVDIFESDAAAASSLTRVG